MSFRSEEPTFDFFESRAYCGSLHFGRDDTFYSSSGILSPSPPPPEEGYFRGQYCAGGCEKLSYPGLYSPVTSVTEQPGQ